MNNTSHNIKQLWWLVLSIVILLVDQISKLIILIYLTNQTSKTVLPMLNLTLLFNQGAAFSLLSSAGGWQQIFFSALAIIITALLIIYLMRAKQRIQCFATSLIIAGALGNLVDRLHYGFVIDFIDLHIGSYHWPVFNIADSAITVGVILLIISYYFSSINNRHIKK